MSLQRASLSVLLVLAVIPSLLWTTGTASSMAVTADARTTSLELSAHQHSEMLEKDWTLTFEELQGPLGLDVEVAGLVFVDYDSSLRGTDVVAKVVMRSDSSDMLDLVRVDAANGDYVRVQYKNQDGLAKGFVMTQITVGSLNAVHSVKAALDVTLVLGDGVVVRDDPAAELHFVAHGDCRVLVGSPVDDVFTLRALDITSWGDSLVQLETASLRLAADLQIKMSGDSTVAVLASERIVAEGLESSTQGDGNLYVQTNSLEVQMLRTSVSGDGYVAYSPAGSCMKQQIDASGDASVAVGSIVCKDSEVSVSGEATVVLQTTDSLVTSSMGDSSIRYVNERPKTVQSLGSHLHHGQSDVEAEKRNNFKTYSPISPPSREPTALAIVVSSSWFSDRPSVNVFGGFDPFAMELQRFDFLTAGPTGHLGVVALLGMVALVVVAVQTLHRRRAREQYQPLL